MHQRGRAIVLLGCLSLAAIAGRAQAPAPQPTGTGVIVGRVIDADTKAPVGSVIVTLSRSGAAATTRIIADVQGRFAFRNLPRGSYTITTTAGANGFTPSGFLVTGTGHLIGGYLNGGFGQLRPEGPLQTIELGDDQRIANAEIRLWKAGAIEGTVVDEAGEPLVNVLVAAARVSRDGRLLTGPSWRTDDRGAYRIPGLTPGAYVVVTPITQVLMPADTAELLADTSDERARLRVTATGGPRPPAAGVRSGQIVHALPGAPEATNAFSPVERDGRRYVYATTFHPASATVKGATVVSVASGEERTGVDIRLTPVPAVAVSGTLTDDAGIVPNFAVRLLPADSSDGSSVLDVATTVTDARGVFTFPLVPPGRYAAIAIRPPAPQFQTGTPPEPRSVADRYGAWAREQITVGEQAVNGVALTLRAALTISGRFEFRGASAQPTAARLRQLSFALPLAQPLIRAGTPPPRAGADPTGAFQFTDVMPGAYVMRPPDLPPWTVESVHVAGRDVTDAVVSVDDDIDDVRVTMTDRPAEISGSVQGSTRTPAGEASVFVFPADRARWPHARLSTRTFRTVRVADGAFRVTPLPPGTYYIVAIADTLAADWPDEALLARLANAATTVRLGSGVKHAAALTVSDLR